MTGNLALWKWRELRNWHRSSDFIHVKYRHDADRAIFDETPFGFPQPYLLYCFTLLAIGQISTDRLGSTMTRRASAVVSDARSLLKRRSLAARRAHRNWLRPLAPGRDEPGHQRPEPLPGSPPRLIP